MRQGLYPVLESWPKGVEPLRDYRGSALRGLTLVHCRHTDRLPNGLCRFCHADRRETRPVKRLVFAPEELTLI